MKELNKKKVVVGLLSVGIVASMSISVYTSKHLNNDNANHNPKTNQPDSKQEVSQQQKEKPKEPVIKNTLTGKDDPALSKDKKEMKIFDVTNTESEVRKHFRNFNFKQGTVILDGLSRSLKFTGDAEILKKLHYDGSLFMNLVPQTEQTRQFQKGDGTNSLDETNANIIEGLQDPENTLLGVLYLDPISRERIILYSGSLNPIVEEMKSIQIIKKTTDDIPHEVGILYPETKIYHKITFVLEGFTLDAYVLEDQNGGMRFYSIEDPTKKSYFYTISQWKKIRKNLEKGLPALDGVIPIEGTGNVQSLEGEEKIVDLTEIPSPDSIPEKQGVNAGEENQILTGTPE